MSLEPVAIRACGHTMAQHAFRHVLCPNQSLLQKTFRVVCACLVFAVIGWQASAYIIDRMRKTLALRRMIEASRIYTPVGQDAIQEAVALAAEVPYSGRKSPPNTCKPTHKPIDPFLPAFEAHYLIFEITLKTVLLSNSELNAAWSNLLVTRAADKCMKLAYAVSCFSLEVVLSDLSTEGLDESSNIPAQLLTRPNSAQSYAFFVLPRVYREIRGAMYWNSRQQAFQCPDSQRIPKRHAAFFYEKGTQQHAWRVLYNHYCKRVGALVSLQELEKRDPRFVKWIQLDLALEADFQAVPADVPVLT